jgi:hypothetical protein
MSIVPPGRERPTKPCPVWSTSAHQESAMDPNVPQPLAATREITRDMREFFQWAVHADHPLREVETTLPADLEAAVAWVAQKGPAVTQWRCDQMLKFERISESLRPYSDMLMSGVDERVAWAAGDWCRCAEPCWCAKAHPALLMALVDALEWPDVGFPVRHCLTGADVIGEAPDSGLWRLKSDSRLEADRTHKPMLSKHALYAGANRGTGDDVLPNSEWNMRAVAGRRKAMARARAAGGAEFAAMQAVWDSSMAEVDSPWTGPGEESAKHRETQKRRGTSTKHTIGEVDAMFGRNGWRAIVRHGVEQGEHEDGSPKIRPVDDASGNHTNSAHHTREQMTLPTVSWMATIGRALCAHGVRGAIGGGCDDESDAYRNSATRQPEFTVVVVPDPTTGEVYAFIPRGHNFGLGSAPNTYSAKPEFVCAVARRLFAAIVDHYVDDYASCEPQFALGPTRHHAVKALRRPASTQGVLFMTAYVLGAPVSAAKHQPWSQTPEFIGVVTDMTDIHRDAIRLWCKPATREKVSRMIAGYMEPGASMTPGQAASLHGKCGWAMLRARMGRSALSALINRQYHSHGNRGVGETLRRSMAVLLDIFTDDTPVVLPTRPRPRQQPVVILTDASYEEAAPGRPHGSGHLGQVVWIPDDGRGPPPCENSTPWRRQTVQSPVGGRAVDGWLSHAAMEAPAELLAWSAEFKDKETYIVLLELVAMASAYVGDIAEAFRGRDVLHFADNQSANGGLVKGRSPAPDLNTIIGETHDRWADLDIRPWVEYVRSEANVADLPSRGAGADVGAALHMITRSTAYLLPELVKRRL